MQTRPGIEAQAEVWERRLYEAMIALDYGRLDELLADDLVYIHSTGVPETKAEYFAGLRDGLYEYERIGTRSARTFASGDLVVRNGIVDMRVGERGRNKDQLALLHTFLWRVTGEDWTLVIRQATRIPA